MQQSLVQMNPQMGRTPHHLDPLHSTHLKPDYLFALQQQQHFQQQAQQQYQYLSQTRAVRPQQPSHQNAAVAAAAAAAGTPQRATFPIRASQPLPALPGTQASHSQLQHHGLPAQNMAAAAAAAAAAAGTPAFAQSNGDRSLAERLPDYQLRRKTPNGTIDAGYDGSPASLAAGPPPFKQMALPASSTIFPTAAIQQQDGTVRHIQLQQQQAAAAAAAAIPNGLVRQPTLSAGTWPYRPTNVGAAAAAAQAAQNAQAIQAVQAVQAAQVAQAAATHSWNADAAAATANMANMANIAVDQAPLFQTAALLSQMRSNGSNGMLVQPVFSPSYQASPGPTAFNSASFTPQPIWPDSALLQGYQTQSFPFNMVNVDSSLGLMQPAIPGNAYISATQPLFNTAVPNANGNAQPLAAANQANMFGYAPVSLGDPGLFFQNAQNLAQNQSQNQQALKMSNASLLHSPIQALEMLSMGPPAALPLQTACSIPAHGEERVQFKERVLAQAEKTYMDLLVYLTHTKKSLHGRPLPSLRSSMKTSSALAKSSQMQQLQSPFANHAATQNQQLAAMRTHQGQLLAHANSNSYAAAAMANAMGTYQPYMAKMYGVAPAATQNMFLPHSPLIPQAKSILELLSTLCEQSGWKWIDGMLLGGCLHYGLEHFEQALEWFNRIFALKPDHVEVMSNIAATLYCLERRDEAEKYWFQAIRARPSYLEPAEHLASLLAAEQRNREAVDMIEFVQDSLRIRKSGSGSGSGSVGGDNDGNGSEFGDASQDAASKTSFTDGQETVPAAQGSPESASTQPGFGSSGYAVPGHDNGRMLILIHTKANILYAMKEITSASRAYEEAVLIGTGRGFRCIQNLIRRIHAALTPADMTSNSRSYFPRPATGSPLLSPDRAKLTARLVFAASHGQLPGLRYIPENHHRKSAIATTSNALLSMAKILQDGMANNGYASPGGNGQTSPVADILALYYLSLSLQESPSTANNVGILLASVQQSPVPSDAQLQRQKMHQQMSSAADLAMQQSIPTGITPGSGLALAFAYYSYGLRLDPKHVHLHTNLGSLLKDVGHLDLAIKMYEQAVACDGTFDIALTNLANAVKDRGRVADAIVYYRRAVASNPDFAEAVCGLSTALNSVCDWNGRGGVVLYNGRYDRWHVDDNGMLRDVRQARHGSGLVQRVVDIVNRQLKEGSSWGSGILHGSAIAMLASQMKDAIGELINDDKDSYDNSQPMDITAELQRWVGQEWEGSRVLRLIERATRVVMRRWYQDRYVHGVEKPNTYARPRLPASLTVPSAPTVLPFHTFTCPLPAKEIRLISQRNAYRISCSTLRSPWLSGSVYPPPPPPQPQLNIGYISSDFNNHPLAHLMQSVFGLHNPTRAKAFCYATTASDKSIHRQQIEREAPVFHDVTNWAPERVIEQIMKDNIHILVNLNGYTRGARNEIFAARPAPIQMAFMGFAGTLGAEWCDYLLADTMAVPPSTLRPWRGNVSVGDVFRDEMDTAKENWIYSENLIYCRDTFFCCDHKQSANASEHGMTWQDEQHRRWKMRKELFPTLSDDTIIMGNFNQLYKIDPTTFRSWLRILAGVPNAVLWLLRFPELGEVNLRKTAVSWAGEDVASRIIFTDVAPKHLHISRARVCDLFLDTPECNAHTTAADILWSSTPLLTLPRYEFKMCSRIGASILKGALPKTAEGDQAAAELITANESEYEKAAIRLASSLTYRLRLYNDNGASEVYGEGSGRLSDLRKLLWDNKWTCGLFDTQRWVNDLEDAYEAAWDRWVTGERGDIYL